MNPQSNFNGTGISTAFGTLLSIIPGLHLGDIVQSAVLAAIGASVSFLVTLAWKHFTRKKR
jgi:hypothetical protein